MPLVKFFTTVISFFADDLIIFKNVGEGAKKSFDKRIDTYHYTKGFLKVERTINKSIKKSTHKLL